jgi:hypothetical protein
MLFRHNFELADICSPKFLIPPLWKIKMYANKVILLIIICFNLGSWDRSVSLGTGYGLDGQVRFLAGVRDFSLCHSVNNGSGTHPDSYPLCSRGSFPECKAAGHEADHSPPSLMPRSRMGELYLHSPSVFRV